VACNYYGLVADGQYREIMEVMKGMVKDSANCVLSYVLSQPVQIDVIILLVFMLEYVGLHRMVRVIKLVRSGSEFLLYELKHSSSFLFTAGFSQRSGE
jgi:hypothetical protein